VVRGAGGGGATVVVGAGVVGTGAAVVEGAAVVDRGADDVLRSSDSLVELAADRVDASSSDSVTAETAPAKTKTAITQIHHFEYQGFFTGCGAVGGCHGGGWNGVVMGVPFERRVAS
jgi:hypothetical protein